MEVVDVDRVLGDVDAVLVGRAVDGPGLRRRRRPARTRRPSGGARGPGRSAFSWYGVRPNSVVQTTSVSSSIPRDFRSVSRPAMGRSTFRARGTCVSMSPWASQLFEAPVSISSTNRTPRSASRRATRHCQAKPLRRCPAPGRRARASRRSRATGRRPRGPRAACRRPSRTTGSARRGPGRGPTGPGGPRFIARIRASSSSCKRGRAEPAVDVGDRLGAGDDPRPLVAAGEEVGAPDLVAGVGDVAAR